MALRLTAVINGKSQLEYDRDKVLPKDQHAYLDRMDAKMDGGIQLNGEAIADPALQGLGNVTWIVDYNRQNLDGTRIPNERSLRGADCDRIERTAEANGWRVVQLRHGSFREKLFALPGGESLRELFEQRLSDSEYQALMFADDAERLRARAKVLVPASAPLVDQLTDAFVVG
mgnify:CR=1 FL=1